MFQEDKAWVEYREKFSEWYDDDNYASPLQSWVMHSSHKLVEKSFSNKSYFQRIIEVGAGTGEHAPFVRHKFDDYTLTDLDPKTLDVARKKLSSTHDGRLKFEVQKGSELAYPDGTFDRLIATHILEHIYQPHLALKEWRRVMKDGGLISVLIPADPGLAWKLGRHLGPRKKAMKKGIAYDYLMAREHVNSCNNLIALLRHYFPASKEAWWPFPIPSIDMNLFFCFQATVDKQSENYR